MQVIFTFLSSRRSARPARWADVLLTVTKTSLQFTIITNEYPCPYRESLPLNLPVAGVNRSWRVAERSTMGKRSNDRSGCFLPDTWEGNLSLQPSSPLVLLSFYPSLTPLVTKVICNYTTMRRLWSAMWPTQSPVLRSLLLPALLSWRVAR
jgi:hypothetical protein